MLRCFALPYYLILSAAKRLAYFWSELTILLHHFVKKTQKTPKREIETAHRRLQDYKERYDNENNR